MGSPLYADPSGIPPVPPYLANRNAALIQYVLLVGQDPAAVSPGFEFPILKCDANGHLRVAREQNSAVTFFKFTAADGTSDPKQLDIGFLGANRDLVTITNTSDKDFYLKLGPGPSVTSFTKVLRKFDSDDNYWSIPISSPFYGGAIWGFWPEPTNLGGVMLMEMT